MVEDFVFRVTCLNVNGNRATIGGRLDEPSGTSALFFVTDNAATGQPDEAVEFFTVPDDCTAPPTGEEPVDGDLVVHDA